MSSLRQFSIHLAAALFAAVVFLAAPAAANTTVSLGSVTKIAGPQDLDLTGEIIYAINFSPNDPARTVNGVTFLPDTQSIPGAVLYGPNNVAPWGNRPDFGSSTDANELEEIVHDIRWASSPDTLSAQLAVTAGERYKLQVICSANGFEDRKWDIRVNGQNAVDEITSMGASPGQTYAQNRATLFTYEFIAPTSTVTVQMGNLFGANEGGDRNPVWQALTLERIFIPPTPDDVVLSPSQFFPTQTAAIGTLQVIDRKSPPVSHTLSFVAGDGSSDNAKFTITGGQLLPQPFNFSSAAPGTTYSIRVRAVDAADAGRFIEKALTVSVATPQAPTAVTLDTTTVSALGQPGALVGNLLATDPNSFDKHTFALVSGAGSTNNALFNVAGGELRFAQAIPPGTASVSVRLRATDLVGLTVETVLTLPVVNPQLRINELLSGNTTGLLDESLQPQDWLEIYNELSQPVDLAGWYLTDDADNLTKWQFPSRVIAPNGYLTVFCDGRETPPAGSSLLHTNFSLSSGERVMLVKPDGITIANELNPTASLPNVTYGWNAAGTQTGYLITPTPGAVNSALATIGENAVVFSQPHGFYTSTFSLTLSAAPGSTIRYTLDGSKPTATTGTVYSGPITISPDTNGPTRGTRIVRAIAVNSQAAYTPVATQTYLFINGIGAPSSNGVVGQSNLAASITGNATYGPLLDDALLALPSVSVILPSGLSTSEAEGSVELFSPGGAEAGFQINCGVNATGTTSLGSPKLSMAAKFRTQYGPSQLEYPVYAVGSLAPPGATTEFKELRLRSHSHDTFYWLGTAENPPVPYGSPSITRSGDAQIGRNLWIEEMQLLMGQPGKHGRQVHLYLNGAYHGIYHIQEHADEDFMASYFPGGSEDFHYTGGATTGSDHGNGDTWSATWATVKNSLGNYNEAKRWIDLTNLADYMVLSFYAGNDWDWSTQHNWGAAGPKLPDKGGWKFFQQDSDIALQALNADSTDQNVPDGIFYTLMNYEDFRVLFRDRAYKHLFHDGMLTPVKAGALYDTRMTEIYTAVIAESARWQPGSSVGQLPWDRNQEWVNEWNYLKNTFFPGRTAVLLNQLRAHPNWWPVEPVVMNQHGGSVPSGFVLTLSAPAGSIYYTTDGSDPRSYNTVTGADTVSATAILYTGPITILNSRTIRTRVRNSGTWSAMNDATFYTPQDFTKLVVSEINYNPTASGAVSGDEFEFLELKNIGTDTLDLGGCTFTSGITYTFPIGTTLAPGGFFVLARDATVGQTNFHSRYPGVTVNGIYTGKLDNSGETLTIAAPTGGNIFSLTYDDALPWPVSADGNGFTAVPMAAIYNSDSGVNWRGSANIFGSPGTDDPAVTTSVVINEILTNSQSPFKDTIELHNPTNASVNVGYWWLTDDPNTPKKYQIAAGTVIPAGGFAVFDETHFNPTPGVGLTSFALNSAGDDVYLFSGDAGGNLTGYSHGFAFAGAELNVSFGRIVTSAGDEYFPRQISRTFGATNSGPLVGPLVINEVMYHPYTDYDEFVEIRNISGATVLLYDPANPTNTWKIGGLGYTFAVGQSIPAGGYALVTALAPATFRAKYNVPISVQIFGPYTGSLQDNGERISIEMPDTPVLNNLGQTIVPYDVIDSVRYINIAPWPTAAAGAGPSLQRISASAYGDDPANWFANGLSAGFPNGINEPPAILIATPATNSPYTAPAVVTFTSAVSDADGTVIKVEYYSGVIKLGESTTGPNYSFAWTSTSGTHTITAKATDNSLGVTTSAPITVFVTTAITQGLKGDYYGNKTLTAPIAGTRTDFFSSSNTINFNVSSNPAWPTTYGFPTIGTTNFSVRWSGQIRATATGNHTFSTIANDGVRLTVNGTQIINNWNDVVDGTTATTASGAIALTSGQLYDIVLEYYQNTGTGSINLKWVVPGFFQSNVPQAVLYPDSVPIMVNHPAALSKDQGTSASFTALASGHGLSYQWRKNGVFIPGANSQSYTIPYCLPGDAAQYSVFVSNSHGFAISNNAQLTVTFTDTDGDGIQNYWETANGLNPNSAADAALDGDGDGFSNLQESLAGTEPNNPNSKFSLGIVPAVSGPGYTLTFTAQPYKSYTVQYKDTLTAASWTTLQSYPATPAQQTITHTDPTGTAPRFYRVITP